MMDEHAKRICMKSKEDLQLDLRKRAQKRSLLGANPSIEELEAMSTQEIAQKMRELHLHQIELEMQNEELYKTQEELHYLKTRYFELYNMAPMGYLTLDADGRILESNNASVEILEASHEKLRHQSLSHFIYPQDQDIYYMFRKKIAASMQQQICELRMHTSEGKVFWTQLIASSKNKSLQDASCKLIFNDISESRALKDIKEHNEVMHNFSKNILKARESERKSIAREVHDQLGQLMSVLKIDLLWLKRKIPQESQELMIKVNTMLEYVNLGLQSVRSIVAQLRPLILDDLGLEAAMRWYVKKYLKSANMKYDIRFKADELLFNEDIKIVLFRVFQEALTNVIHHSNATKCSISLIQKEETLILKIKDNGIGVTQTQIENPKSFGLIGIRERLYPYAGRLSISGDNGRGASLIVTIENFKKELQDD